jgi:hypothetical protein
VCYHLIYPLLRIVNILDRLTVRQRRIPNTTLLRTSAYQGYQFKKRQRHILFQVIKTLTAGGHASTYAINPSRRKKMVEVLGVAIAAFQGVLARQNRVPEARHDWHPKFTGKSSKPWKSSVLVRKAYNDLEEYGEPTPPP